MVLIPIKSWDSVTTEDFIPIPDSQLVEDQLRLINTWEPFSEVWSLKYGGAIVGAAAAISGAAVNGMFRNKLKLHSHGRSMSHGLAALFPGLMAAFLHEQFLTRNMMLYKAKCSMCYELQAGLIVNAAGILFPLLTIPWLNLGIAANVGLRVPYILEVKEVANFWWNVVKPASKHLLTLSFFNCSVSGVVAHKQLVSMETIANVLLKMEKDLNSES